MDENIDQIERRCPRLGGSVSFAYCKTSGDDHSVCWKIFDCWWECFDVVGYLQKTLPEDQFKRLADSKPKQKIVSLVELVEQAKKRVS
ncbi:MAG: hypothetical protein JRE28_01360 [Deltaproteobacteria bacterium]|nr:hypothetical protein [Deltaproteobacteria bacterium]